MLKGFTMKLKMNFRDRAYKRTVVGIIVVMFVALFFNNCSPGFSSVSSISQSSVTVGTNGSGPTVGVAILTWLVPAQNTDGSALTDLAGYHIYYGTSQNALSQMITIASPSATSFQVNNLAQGTWYFAVAAYNTSGVESARSNVGSKVIQ